MTARCAGFDDNGDAFDCPNRPGTPWTPIWCAECDDRRRARLTLQFQQLADEAMAHLSVRRAAAQVPALQELLESLTSPFAIDLAPSRCEGWETTGGWWCRIHEQIHARPVVEHDTSQ